MSAIRLDLAVAVAFVAMAGCGGGGGQGSSVTGPTTVSSVGVSARVSTIGDSITAGKDPVVPYPPRLQTSLRSRNPRAVVINRGVPGQTVGEGLQTLAMALSLDQPGFVLIMEGTNDVNLGHAPTQTASFLQQMLQLAKQAGAVPILATIPAQFGPRADAETGVVALNAEIRRVASQERVTLADVFGSLPDESFFTDDGFHPNDKGQAAIAATFDAALAASGYPTTLLAHRRP